MNNFLLGDCREIRIHKNYFYHCHAAHHVSCQFSWKFINKLLSEYNMRQGCRFLYKYVLRILALVLIWKTSEYVLYNGESTTGIFSCFFEYSKYMLMGKDGVTGTSTIPSNSKSMFLELRKEKMKFGERKQVLTGDNVNIVNETVILMWTKFYDFPDSVVMQKMQSGRAWDSDCCTGKNLIVTLDRSLLLDATVVVFFNYFRNLDIKDVPSLRPARQLWVLFSLEGPVHTPSLRHFSGMFNWTMTYRRDSDIWSPYGFTTKLESPIPASQPIIMPGNIPLSQWIANKSGVLAGVISHCPTNSKREDILQAIRNASVPVDIFGKCGDRPLCHYTNLSCDHTKFWSKLASTYLFYFAGENSLCTDYITEKFWRTLELGMVPIVYGGADYTAVAPPHSFIDVRQFKSAKHTAEYLKRLIEDPLEYKKYFEWRRKYRVIVTDGWGGWCKLCRLAKQYNENPGEMKVSPQKSYGNLESWWHMTGEDFNHSACVQPLSLLQSKPKI